MSTAAIAVETPIGVVGVEATEAGVRRVRLPNGSALPPAGSDAGPAASHAAAAVAQFEEYFGGERERFDFALDWAHVEPGHRHVLETLLEAASVVVTVTYGDLGGAMDRLAP